MRNTKDLLKATSLIAMMSAMAVSGASYAQDAKEEKADEDLEEIVVTGIRSSLKKAIAKKRAAQDIRDIINAEDIGKLPDTNVAEALQRITGIQIGRDMGEGAEVSVRGISQNRIEVNGQTQPGRGAETSVSFDNLPAALFSSLEVIKTPSAKETEGALGAIIRLNTRKPLEVNKDFTASGSLKNIYSNLAQEWAPMGNATVTKKWEDTGLGDFGLLLSYNFNKRKLRQDIFETRGWVLSDGWGIDVNGNGVIDDPMTVVDGVTTERGDAGYHPGQLRSNLKLQDRKNTTYKGTLQWKPSDTLDFTFDGSWTDSTRADSQFVAQQQIHNRKARDYDANYSVFSDQGTLLSGLVSPGNGRGVNPYFGSSINPYDANIYTFNIAMDWQASDKLSVHADYAQGHGEENSFYSNLNQAITGAEHPDVFFDFTGDTTLPTLLLYPRNTSDLSTAEPYDLTSLSTYSFAQIASNRDLKQNTDKAFKLDFDYQTEWGPIKSIEFGLRLAEREGSSYRDRAKVKFRRSGDRPTFTLMSATNPDLITSMPGSILEGVSGNVPTNWDGVNTIAYMADHTILTDFFESYAAETGVDILVNDQLVDFTSVEDSYFEDKSIQWYVKEKTQALYAQANFEGDMGSVLYTGNFGLRYVKTKQIAEGFSSIDNNQTFTDVALENSYDDFLPSMNINFILTDDLILRLGASVSMARPRLLHVAPTRRISESGLTINQGNVNLKPEKSRSLDTSLEWYFAEGGLLSVAGFMKTFVGAIEEGRTSECNVIVSSGQPDIEDDDCAAGSNRYLVTTYINNDTDLKVKGFEIAYQQQFTMLPGFLSGFGTQLNYTLTDSTENSLTKYGDLVGKQDLSKHSYNIVGYYEKYGFSARAAYNWRSAYYDTVTFTGAPSTSKAYGQLDLSVSYKLNDHVTVQAEALNVTGNAREYYQVIEERFLSYKKNDSRFQFGISAKF